MRTAVVVLGDLGRSPRMQYHAHSLAVNGADVDLIGLEGAPLPAALTSEPRIQSHRLSDRAFASRATTGRTRFVWMSAARAARQSAALFTTLLRLPRPDVILVQNPPALPTLAVAWTVARLRGARFVIDWHNLSHTMLAVRLGPHHRAVRALKRSERRWAARADVHLAVSQSLADWLQREWKVRATVLYDRPTAAYAQPSPELAGALWQRLARDLALGERRIPIVVAPTSWTPDEDFDLLLEALERAERGLTATLGQGDAAAPALAVLLTGRGAMQQTFEHRLSRRGFRHIAVRTTWLESADYPTLIGMADAGLCLHLSSSGLDLPMKLADFRGAGVPVCAFDYGPVLSEALTSGHEGVTFHEPGQLATALMALASRDEAAVPGLTASRAWLRDHPAERWDEHWNRVARGVCLA